MMKGRPCCLQSFGLLRREVLSHARNRLGSNLVPVSEVLLGTFGAAVTCFQPGSGTDSHLLSLCGFTS